MNEEQRLNKRLAFLLGISRREADDYISQGRVLVNGAPVELGKRVRPTDILSVDGTPLAIQKELQYIALHKPVGYVCSRRTQGDTPTIYSLLPSELHHLKPVGRLDKDSSGILLLTNDGDFAHQMTHPSFHKTKTYEVSLDPALSPLHQQMISDHGITLDDGPSKLLLERMSDDRRQWRVQMHEGRNRQIRRTFGSLGYDVVTLHRTHFGAYQLSNLEVGHYQATRRQ